MPLVVTWVPLVGIHFPVMGTPLIVGGNTIGALREYSSPHRRGGLFARESAIPLVSRPLFTGEGPMWAPSPSHFIRGQASPWRRGVSIPGA